MVDSVNLGPARPVQVRIDQNTDTSAKTSRLAASTDSAVPTLPKLLSLVAELSSQEPPIDSGKIQEIRQMIAAGSYKVDSDATAAAMIRYFGMPSA